MQNWPFFLIIKKKKKKLNHYPFKFPQIFSMVEYIYPNKIT